MIENNNSFVTLEDGRELEDNDYSLANYHVGGYVWEVRDMQMLNELIPATGKLGLWEYDLG